MADIYDKYKDFTLRQLIEERDRLGDEIVKSKSFVWNEELFTYEDTDEVKEMKIEYQELSKIISAVREGNEFLGRLKYEQETRKCMGLDKVTE